MAIADVVVPRFPAASKKRGMARAVEIVEWHIGCAKAYGSAATPGSMVASVWSEKVSAFESIRDALKREMR